ncbi:MAG: hypothetical protein GY856_46225 [bacterium]|nr:hypothetical protein [bacterium]
MAPEGGTVFSFAIDPCLVLGVGSASGAGNLSAEGTQIVRRIIKLGQVNEGDIGDPPALFRILQ